MTCRACRLVDAFLPAYIDDVNNFVNLPVRFFYPGVLVQSKTEDSRFTGK